MAAFDHAVGGRDALGGLERDDLGLGAGAEAAVGGADVVPQRVEPLLEHGGVAVPVVPSWSVGCAATVVVVTAAAW